jgi:hypothetical protein
MGGIVCNIFHNAIITDPTSDAQWRTLFATGDVAQTIANETGSAEKLCTILAKPAFSAADKVWFQQLLASLWQGYS